MSHINITGLSAITICAFLLASPLLAQEQNSECQIVLDSAKVSADRLPIAVRGSNFIYTPEHAAGVVSVIGEPDIVRQMVTLPGVSPGIEGTLGLFVRGGNSGNSRLEVDDVPIFNSTHALGLFSSFPSEMLSAARLYTGGFSADKRNFTSSSLSADLKSGAAGRYSGKFSISPYIGSLFMEFPGRLESKIEARYSPLLQIGHLISSSRNEDVNGLIFDVTAISSYDINSDNHLKFAAFFASDGVAYYSDSMFSANGWQTWMAKAEWKSEISRNSSLDGLIYGSGSKSREKQINYYNGRPSIFSFDSTLYEIAAKADLTSQINKWVSGKCGVDTKLLTGMLYASAFIVFNAAPSDRISLSMSCRNTSFLMDGKLNNNYDLHFLSDFTLSDHLGLEISYDRINQYYHILEGLPTGWPLNLAVPILERYPEETAHQFYSGFFSKFKVSDAECHVCLGGYYKRMDNIVSYISSLNMFRNISNSWEYDCSSGTGRSFSIESSFSWASPRLSANASFTWSHSDRTFSEINEGNTYPYKFDLPFIFNTQADYQTFAGQHLLLDLSYSSGSLMTIGMRQYYGMQLQYWNQSAGYPESFSNNIYDRVEMSAVNGCRLPDYFRIDVGYSLEIYKKKVVHTITFTLYNVLNRHNPYLIFNDSGTWKQLSIMPIVPCIRYSVAF